MMSGQSALIRVFPRFAIALLPPALGAGRTAVHRCAVRLSPNAQDAETELSFTVIGLEGMKDAVVCDRIAKPVTVRFQYRKSLINPKRSRCVGFTHRDRATQSGVTAANVFCPPTSVATRTRRSPTQSDHTSQLLETAALCRTGCSRHTCGSDSGIRPTSTRPDGANRHRSASSRRRPGEYHGGTAR